MKTAIIVLSAAAALLVAGPAAAKVTIACKSTVEAGGNNAPTQTAARSSARSKWVQKVGSIHGRYWTQLSLAKSPHYKCKDYGSHWYCRFLARPCGQVKPPSASQP